VLYEPLRSVAADILASRNFARGTAKCWKESCTGRHTLAVLPARGLGTSLCYQLASTFLPGLTLVNLSVMSALMQDQV